MAEDEAGGESESGEAEADTQEKPGKGKSLIILVITGLLLVGLSVGGTIFALKMFGAPANPDGEPMEEDLESAKNQLYITP